MPVVSRPLLLDGALLPSLRLASNGRVSLGSTGEFHLPLTCIQQWPPMPSLLTPCQTTDRAASQSGATATATVTSMSSISPSLLVNGNTGENGKTTKRFAQFKCALIVSLVLELEAPFQHRQI